MERTAQFTMELFVDADNKAIYVDSKAHKGGVALSFGSFTAMVDHLRQLAQVMQVIVPRASDLETLKFQTGLKVRPNKLSQHERLARRLASLKARVSSKAFFGGDCDAADGERYQEALSYNRQLSVARLKVEIRQTEANRKRLAGKLDKIAEEAIPQPQAA